MGVDIIDVILCVQRIDTTLSHMFLLPTQEGDLGGILTNRDMMDVAQSQEA